MFRTGNSALLIALLCSAAPVGAQDRGQDESAEAAGRDRTIVITATGLSSATSTTKTDSPIIESPQSISIINQDEIDLRAATTVSEALAYTSGVQASQFGIDSRTDEISIRGFGAGGFSSNNNFVDGLRLPAGGQFTRFSFDPFALQQIEVLKGPSSVLYGQTAPGGIVNMVSKRPTSTFQGHLIGQVQGFSGLDDWSGRIGADVSGPLNGPGSLQGRLVGLAQSGGTQIEEVENSRYYVSPSLTFAPDSDTSWTLLGQYQRDEGNATYQFLPATGTYFETNGGYIANDANLGEPDWNTFDRDQILIGSFFEHRFDDTLTFRSNARYTHIESLYRVSVLSGDTVQDCDTEPAGIAAGENCIPGRTIGRRAIQAEGTSDGIALDNQLQFDLSTGPIEHTLLAGVDYFHTEWEHFRDLVTLPGLPPGQVDPLFDILNPQPRGSDNYEANLAPQIYGAAESDQTGIYFQDQLALGGLRVTVGGRFDSATDDNRNLTNDTAYRTKADDFTWRAGGVYLFDNGLAPYFSYSESFLPQLVDPSSTLTGEPFLPTTGRQYEAGLRYQGGRGIYLSAGAFDITQQNVPTRDPGGTLCGRLVCQIQAGEARVRGLEFEGRASLPTGTTLIASATHLDSEVTEDTNESIVGNAIPQVAKYLASLFVNQRIDGGALAGLGFGGGVRYTGRSYGDTNNVFHMQDYTLFDLFLRYDLDNAAAMFDGVSLSLNAQNIADKRYVVTCSSPQSCYYGQGRTLTARVQYRW
ncbi:TonB-dependent siderophore receptor [Pacificimonas flava]|uniref:TonB-dependent receptor n=1 Tax=Pacificimonas flava TaxID=1234595 RepID=M2T9P9_9SPHN|nr:TonB-dependent siderophore receptor [Pacificimonas flava]EMD83304.1 TonB-dependent receptor [Pacificimonas flava]MBB5279136.1 iron complex outermembrane receptor protein [Pacificimonas flava]